MSTDRIKSAKVIVKETGIEIYVIGHVELTREAPVVESATFLDRPDLGTSIDHFFGYGGCGRREFIYHAINRQHAENIALCIESGKGYAINGVGLRFTRAEASADLDNVIFDLIEKYHLQATPESSNSTDSKKIV